MKAIRTILVIYFVFLIIVDLYGVSQQYHVGFTKYSIYFLCCVIALLFIPTKIAWTILLITSAYGIYNICVVDFNAAEPTFMNVTVTFRHILERQNADKLLCRIVNGMPFYLYVLLVTLLLSRAGRRFYGIIKKT